MRLNSNKILIGGIICMCICLFSCGDKQLRVRDYVKYLNNKDNGTVQTKEVDGLIFKVAYVTPELMALNELKTETIDKAVFEKTLNDYKGLRYYKINIAAADESEYAYNVMADEGIAPGKIEMALNFDMQGDIYEVNGRDTGECVLYQASKTHGLSKTYDLAIAIDSDKKSGDRVLEINSGILNRGLLKFKFSEENLAAIPSLIY